MYQPLAPCSGCSRHVRTTDGLAACPFCGAALPEGFARAAAPGTTQRLSRAAAFVFGTTLALGGCASAAGGGDGAVAADAAADGATASDGAPDDQGGAVAMYGLPAPVDAGAPDDNGGGSADYGSPPPPPDAG